MDSTPHSSHGSRDRVLSCSASPSPPFSPFRDESNVSSSLVPPSTPPATIQFKIPSPLPSPFSQTSQNPSSTTLLAHTISDTDLYDLCDDCSQSGSETSTQQEDPVQLQLQLSTTDYPSKHESYKFDFNPSCTSIETAASKTYLSVSGLSVPNDIQYLISEDHFAPKIAPQHVTPPSFNNSCVCNNVDDGTETGDPSFGSDSHSSTIWSSVSNSGKKAPKTHPLQPFVSASQHFDNSRVCTNDGNRDDERVGGKSVDSGNKTPKTQVQSLQDSLNTTDNTTQLSTQSPSNAIQQFWSTSYPVFSTLFESSSASASASVGSTSDFQHDQLTLSTVSASSNSSPRNIDRTNNVLHLDYPTNIDTTNAIFHSDYPANIDDVEWNSNDDDINTFDPFEIIDSDGNKNNNDTNNDNATTALTTATNNNDNFDPFEIFEQCSFASNTPPLPKFIDLHSNTRKRTPKGQKTKRHGQKVFISSKSLQTLSTKLNTRCHSHQSQDKPQITRDVLKCMIWLVSAVVGFYVITCWHHFSSPHSFFSSTRDPDHQQHHHTLTQFRSLIQGSDAKGSNSVTQQPASIPAHSVEPPKTRDTVKTIVESLTPPQPNTKHILHAVDKITFSQLFLDKLDSVDIVDLLNFLEHLKRKKSVQPHHHIHTTLFEQFNEAHSTQFEQFSSDGVFQAPLPSHTYNSVKEQLPSRRYVLPTQSALRLQPHPSVFDPSTVPSLLPHLLSKPSSSDPTNDEISTSNLHHIPHPSHLDKTTACSTETGDLNHTKPLSKQPKQSKTPVTLKRGFAPSSKQRKLVSTTLTSPHQTQKLNPPASKRSFLSKRQQKATKTEQQDVSKSSEFKAQLASEIKASIAKPPTLKASKQINTSHSKTSPNPQQKRQMAHKNKIPHQQTPIKPTSVQKHPRRLHLHESTSTGNNKGYLSNWGKKIDKILTRSKLIADEVSSVFNAVLSTTYNVSDYLITSYRDKLNKIKQATQASDDISGQNTSKSRQFPHQPLKNDENTDFRSKTQHLCSVIDILLNQRSNLKIPTEANIHKFLTDISDVLTTLSDHRKPLSETYRIAEEKVRQIIASYEFR